MWEPNRRLSAPVSSAASPADPDSRPQAASRPIRASPPEPARKCRRLSGRGLMGLFIVFLQVPCLGFSRLCEVGIRRVQSPRPVRTKERSSALQVPYIHSDAVLLDATVSSRNDMKLVREVSISVAAVPRPGAPRKGGTRGALRIQRLFRNFLLGGVPAVRATGPVAQSPARGPQRFAGGGPSASVASRASSNTATVWAISASECAVEVYHRPPGRAKTPRRSIWTRNRS